MSEIDTPQLTTPLSQAGPLTYGMNQASVQTYRPTDTRNLIGLTHALRPRRVRASNGATKRTTIIATNIRLPVAASGLSRRQIWEITPRYT